MIVQKKGTFLDSPLPPCLLVNSQEEEVATRKSEQSQEVLRGQWGVGKQGSGT